MYINGLFLLFFWCLGWAKLGFVYGSYLVVALLLLTLIRHTRRLSVLGLFAFILASLGQYSHLFNQFPNPWEGKDLLIKACVVKVNSNPNGTSLILTDAQLEVPLVKQGLDNRRTKPVYQGMPNLLSGRIKLHVYPHTKAAQPQFHSSDHSLGLAGLIGQQVNVIGRLKGAKNYLNSQSYDYVWWAALEGQVASGYVKQWLGTGGECGGIDKPKLALEKIRQELWQGLQNYSKTQQMSAVSVALWGALILGQTSALNSEQWQVLAATGTTHLLVISGLHVGLVAVLAMLLVRLLTLPFSIGSSLGIRLGAWVGLVAALCFALLSGFGLPAQRAVIMLTGLMWGAMWGLQLSFSQRLFFAFFVTLIMQPVSASSLGFWLSYTAVFALGLVWYRSVDRPWWSRVIQLFAAQGALSLILLPVIAIGTGQLSVVGPLVNILLVPLFSVFLIPLLLLISIVLMFIGLPQFVFTAIDLTLITLWQWLESLAGLAWVQVFVGWLPWEGFVSLLIVGCLCLIIRRWHWPMFILWLPLGLFLILEQLPSLSSKDINGVSAKNKISSKNPVVVTVLDVGQGLSVWVRQGEHNMLYDVGNSYPSGFNLVDAVILPEMLSQNVTNLDMLVISHWDTDHSGGLKELIKRQTVKRIILPSESNQKGNQVWANYDVTVSRCSTTSWESLWKKQPTSLMWRQIALADYGLVGNNASCVILLNMFGRQVLIAGDIEAKAEGILLKKLDELGISNLASDVLIAPHHGSKTSSTKAFLATVMPAFVLISAGKNHFYGHPHNVITAAYWKQGSQWYNTGRHGQIKVVFKTNGDYQVMPYVR